jgi:hypothetical protein
MSIIFEFKGECQDEKREYVQRWKEDLGNVRDMHRR